MIILPIKILLKELKLLYIFENKEDIQGMLLREWDYDYVNRTIEVKRKLSIEFLMNAIGEKL